MAEMATLKYPSVEWIQACIDRCDLADSRLLIAQSQLADTMRRVAIELCIEPTQDGEIYLEAALRKLRDEDATAFLRLLPQLLDRDNFRPVAPCPALNAAKKKG